jgi:hypothetical protein
MAENIVVNGAEEIPFFNILADLLKTNLMQKPHKMKTFNNLRGVVAIEVTDIETTAYLIFSGGKVSIEKDTEEKSHIIITTDSEKIMGLNFISIKFGLPYYFDKAGMTVIKQLMSGQIKIKGILLHPIILTRLTKVMSVM